MRLTETLNFLQNYEMTSKKNCEVGDINSFKSVVQKFIYKNFIYPVFTGCFNRPYSLYYTIIFYDNIMLI